MPAPNIATLYDFETAYEDALAGYFANVNIGGQTFAQVVTPRSNLTSANFLQTPRCQIKIATMGPMSAGGGLQEETATISNVAYPYYSAYQLQLSVDVVTARSNTSQNHGLLRGGVRQGLLEMTAAMSNTNLPYYQTVFVTPLGSNQGVDPENDEIQTSLTFQIDMQIPPASFPTS